MDTDFSDGGYIPGSGAAAFAVVLIQARREELQTTIIGSRGIFLPAAKSSFHAEVAALDLAIEFVLETASAAFK